MLVALHGIVTFYDNGHEYVDLVVTEDNEVQAIKVRMGVDIELNRGKILTFLSALYGIKPGEIVWPVHIKVN